jgi:hypothetical protein
VHLLVALCPNLVSIDVRRLSAVDATTLLPALHQLESLAIDPDRVQWPGEEAEVEALHQLDMSGITDLSLACDTMNAAASWWVRKLGPHLKTLNVGRSGSQRLLDLSSPSASPLLTCVKLQKLLLGRVKDVHQLTQLPALRDIQLAYVYPGDRWPSGKKANWRSLVVERSMSLDALRSLPIYDVERLRCTCQGDSEVGLFPM